MCVQYVTKHSLIPVLEEHTILSHVVRADLKTISNTEAFVFVLREQIRSICEVGVAWLGPMITKQESNMLERVLKIPHTEDTNSLDQCG